MDQGWKITADQRHRIERCRDDFRHGLPNQARLSATCVTGIGHADVCWDELIDECFTRQVFGDTTVVGRNRVDMAVCLHGQGLEQENFETFIILATNALRMLAAAALPGLASDWYRHGISGTHWVGMVMSVGDANVAGYTIAEGMRYILEGKVVDPWDVPQYDDPYWNELDLRQKDVPVEKLRGRVWTTGVSGDLMRMSMFLLDYLLSTAVVSEEVAAPAKTSKDVGAGGLGQVAAEYRRLAARFVDYRRHNVKANHLELNVSASAIQAGRLLYEAIKQGGFPESRRVVNKQWWDMNTGRYPAAGFQADGVDRVDAHYNLAWTFAVGSWLVKEFPHRFRHGAEALDWSTIAKDAEGRVLGKDGKPTRGQWSFNGKPLPDDFVFDDSAPEGEYEWVRMGEMAKVSDFYDDADMLEHLRVRAEVYESACIVLAELLEAAVPSNVKPSTFTPTQTDLEIEQAIREAPSTVYQADIEAASGHALSIVKQRLPILEKAGRVHRPHGPRSGYALTESNDQG